MRTFLVQRSPNLCPKIYVVLYFVWTQIDRMYISEDQSSECDDNSGATVRYFNSFHETHSRALYGHDLLSSVLNWLSYCSLFWTFKLFLTRKLSGLSWSIKLDKYQWPELSKVPINICVNADDHVNLSPVQYLWWVFKDSNRLQMSKSLWWPIYFQRWKKFCTCVKGSIASLPFSPWPYICLGSFLWHKLQFQSIDVGYFWWCLLVVDSSVSVCLMCPSCPLLALIQQLLPVWMTYCEIAVRYKLENWLKLQRLNGSDVG